MFSRYYSILIIVLAACAGTAFGQTPTPTPAPAATPAVKDKQDVAPEELKGVPAIAPNYRSDDKSLPDLGRVGVDMTDQFTLTLAEAITKALENNKDIEVTRKNVRIAEVITNRVFPVRLRTSARPYRMSASSAQIKRRHRARLSAMPGFRARCQSSARYSQPVSTTSA